MDAGNKRIHHLIAYLLISLVITSCAVGPDFHPLRAPANKRYTNSTLPNKTVRTPGVGEAGKSQTYVYGEDIPGYWWKIFHSRELDVLIRAALANSPNLAAAKAALVQAQQNYNVQLGSTLLPLATGSFAPNRQKFNGDQFDINSSKIFNTFNPLLNVSYTLDVFGGLRRQLEASQAQVDYAQYELEAAYLTMSANIVITAVTIASLREQIEATHAIIKSQSGTLAITRKQYNLGGVAETDVLSQEALVAQTKATLPPLEQQLSQNYHALEALVGVIPDERLMPNFNLNKLHLPADLPVSIPSKLVQQRPDIRAAEALVHQASAKIGVATANLLPSITLTSYYGYQGNVFSQLFQPQNIVWSATASATQTLFNGGALVSARRAAIAGFQQAAAQYRQTVLTAFQNVADTLRALEHDAQLLQAQMAAEKSSGENLFITRRQYRLGGVSYVNLLTAEKTYQQARISRIQAQAARYNDTATLFQALGGGWWNRSSLDYNQDLCRNVAQYEPNRYLQKD